MGALDRGAGGAVDRPDVHASLPDKPPPAVAFSAAREDLDLSRAHEQDAG